MARPLDDDLVADALDAQRRELNAWRVIPCRSDHPDDIHTAAKIYTSAKSIPLGVETVPVCSFQMERHDFSNQEMAEEYVAHRAMRAALIVAMGAA